ncbi:MAG: BamA/TamA family outer membrane protein [Bacteroidia bacterium]|nr:BamA/TamA family outer membrane protein [Bacteroidia bacterium]
MKHLLFCALSLFSFCAHSAESKRIVPGYFIEEIDVVGNHKTKTSIILRELSFRALKFYSKAEFETYHLERSHSNLQNLDLFNYMTITWVKSTPTSSNRIKVQVTVEEKWYFWPIPFIEFADRNFNQWYSLDLDPYRTNYGLYLFKNNLWGLNHTAKFTFGRGYTNTFGFNYVAPYVDKGKQFGFDIDIRHKTNRELQYNVIDNKEQFFRDLDQVLIRRQTARLGLIYRPKLYLTHRISTELNHTALADTILSDGLNPNYLFQGRQRQSTISTFYGLIHDKTDNQFMPLKGSRFTFTGGYNHFMKSSKGYWFTRSSAALFKLIGKGKRPVGIGIHGVYRTSSDHSLPFDHSRALGYDDYVRGYENNVILGNRYGLVKYEVRYILFRDKNFHLRYMPIQSYKDMKTTTFLSLFADHGFSEYRGSVQRINGYGIGLNSMFYYDKVVRFEYSWNKVGESSIKLHFKKAF